MKHWKKTCKLIGSKGLLFGFLRNIIVQDPYFLSSRFQKICPGRPDRGSFLYPGKFHDSFYRVINLFRAFKTNGHAIHIFTFHYIFQRFLSLIVFC